MRFSLPLLLSPEDTWQKPFAVLVISAAMDAHSFVKMATEAAFVFAVVRSGDASISLRMGWARAELEQAAREVVASTYARARVK